MLLPSMPIFFSISDPPLGSSSPPLPVTSESVAETVICFPCRITERLIVSPELNPRILVTSSCDPSILSLLTAMMTSPRRSPAFSAGESGMTSLTIAPFSSDTPYAWANSFVSGWMYTPSHPRRTFPYCTRSFMICFAIFTGTAKPIPCAKGTMAVLIPTTLPFRSMRGPPLFPGLIAASVWRNPSKFTFSAWMLLFFAEMTPTVTVCSSPYGLPIATTHSPTSDLSESPISRTGRLVPSTLMMARSNVGSRPRIFASRFRPSDIVTVILSAPSTTWLLVRILPSAETMNPEPRPFIGTVLEYRLNSSPKKRRKIGSSGKGE